MSAAIRFVYFDLGNVLVKFDHQRGLDNLARLTELPVGQLRGAIFDSGLQRDYEAGQVDDAAFVQRLAGLVGAPLDTADVLAAISDIFWPNEAILPALRWVSAARLGCGLLSNTCQAHWQWIESRSWPMVSPDWFCSTILSYRVRCLKPDRDIYRIAQQQAAVPADQILFIDDLADNVAGAQAAGWQAMHYTGSDQFLADLQLRLGLGSHPDNAAALSSDSP
jgi:glucose-1-phosphatase